MKNRKRKEQQLPGECCGSRHKKKIIWSTGHLSAQDSTPFSISHLFTLFIYLFTHLFFPMLTVYDIAHSLPLGGAGRDFPFTEDEIRRYFSYLSCTFREYSFLCINTFLVCQMVCLNNVFVTALKKKIRIEDLLYSYSGNQTSQSVTSSLMNLVMQFRKVSWTTDIPLINK